MTKKKAAPKKEREMLVVGSKVKAFVKESGCMTAGDVLPALNEKVYALLGQGVERTKANKRLTLRPQDL
ncbi:MAG TPA: hypothetical protein VM223_21005 [Planctomycetota bacterium]|nr:hypothetical protein [Planctomycetota bacterium]